MSLESALYGILAADPGVYALISSPGSPAEIRLYPELADERVKPPYAVYARVGGAPTGTLTGSSIANTRMQIDAYANTATEAQALALAIYTALDGVAVVVNGIGRLAFNRQSVFDKPDPDVRLRCRSQDFSIWHPEV